MSLELLSLENLQEIAHQYGYLAIFLGIALENTGIPLPGETVTIIGGFFAGSGELNYWIVLGSAIAGAILGDNFGYWIGKLGGWSLLVQIGSVFRISESQLEKARKQFSHNAPKAVFLGRFVTLLRVFAGPLAGIAQMPYRQFLLCNFAGAALWGLIMVTISFCFGSLIPLEQLVKTIAQFGILALVFVIASIVLSIWWESRKQEI